MSLAAKVLGFNIYTPVFDGADENDIMDTLDMANAYANHPFDDEELAAQKAGAEKNGEEYPEDMVDVYKRQEYSGAYFLLGDFGSVGGRQSRACFLSAV